MHGSLDPDKPVNYSKYQIIINKYVFASEFIKDRRVLELGCGKGYGANYLAEKGAKKVLGGDVDQEAIAYAQKKYHSNDHMEFVYLNATSLPFDDASFDVVICFDIIEHLENHHDLLHESARVLTDGGLFLCATPNRDSHFSWIKVPHHVHEFSSKELHDLLKSYYGEVFGYGQVLIFPSTIRKWKWYGAILFIGSRLLSIVPFGNQVKQILNRFFVRENRPIEYSERFDEFIDTKYRVLSQNEFLGRIPRKLVIVAVKE